MTLLFDSAVRASVVIGIALLATLLLRRRSAALRHWMLSAAVLCAALMPAAVLVMPSWHVSPVVSRAFPVQILSTESLQVSDAVNPAVAKATTSGVSAQFLERVWLVGFLAALSVLAMGFVRLARVAWNSEPVTSGVWAAALESILQRRGLRRRVRLQRSLNSTMLVTFGFFRPRILLPAASEDWSEERVNVVLAHELAHVRRHDWLLHTLAELVRVVFWFNPFMWLACRRLRLESEYAADDAVLDQGFSASRYAGHLLEIVRDLQAHDEAWSAASPMARASTIERRFSAMLNSNKDRQPMGYVGRIVVAALLLSVSLSVAALSSPAQLPVVAPVVAIAAPRAEAPPVVPQPRPAPLAPRVQQAPAQPTPAKPPAQRFTGELVSFDFKDVDIKDFFRSIAAISSLNITVDPDVTGSLSITLRELPWDQVLDIVMRNNQLGAQLQGNTMRIFRSSQSPTRVLLDFDVVRNGTSLGKFRVSTQQKIGSMFSQPEFTITATPTQITSERTELDMEISVRGTKLSTKGLVVSKDKPGRIELKVNSADFYEIGVTLVSQP